MLSSTEVHDRDETLDYDVCILGSGPAGISTALGLDNTKLRVLVVESSGDRYGFLSAFRGKSVIDSKVQSLYQGRVGGWLGQVCPDYLVSSRVRAYGGTSNVWSGWCWPLEVDDMTSRFSNGCDWPISWSELAPFYSMANRIIGLRDDDPSESKSWLKSIGMSESAMLSLEDFGLKTRFLQLRPLNFKEAFHERFAFGETLDLLQNANLVHLELEGSEECRAVRSIEVRALEQGLPGRMVKVTAKIFVLALGAVESTRVLLLYGLGTKGGVLGKYFSEHPYIWNAASLQINSKKTDSFKLYCPSTPFVLEDGLRVLPAIVPADELIRREGVGSFRVILGGNQDIPGTLNLHFEQEPQPENYIRLIDDKDIFGLKRIELCCNLSARDLKTTKTAVNTTIGALQNLGIVNEAIIPDLDIPLDHWTLPHSVEPGNHPMGTTRMSYSPSNGVVDSKLKVHNALNLFVVGSGVFPSSGYANPTQTIVALASRLSMHILSCLKDT